MTTELDRRADLRPAALLPTRIVAPAPGQQLLACRCGRVLDADQLHYPPRREHQSLDALLPVVCEGCAR